MLLDKLPLELVQHIIGFVVQDDERNDRPRNLTALLGVNKVLESEVTNLCLRNVQDVRHGPCWWAQVPFRVRSRMARDMIMSQPSFGAKRTIATYMHAVACFLQQYAMLHDPDESGRLTHAQWLHEIASVLALRGADCGCGKPAFMHARCYDLSSVSDTAFHVVLLKQYRKLEALMILGEGKGLDSVCPYLQVSKKDPLFTRRNALEWACAHGLEASVVRLIAVAEEQGRNAETYIPTAAAVCAMHTKDNKGALLNFLLNDLDKAIRNTRSWDAKLCYRHRTITLKQWTLTVLISLAQHKRLDAISVLRRHYPYFDSWDAFRVLPKDFCQWQSMKAFMETERPYCNFGKWSDEDEDRKHWTSCRKDWCRNQFSKANPWCHVCKCHHWEQAVCRKCGQHHPPDRHLYDWRGWPTER